MNNICYNCKVKVKFPQWHRQYLSLISKPYCKECGDNIQKFGLPPLDWSKNEIK